MDNKILKAYEDIALSNTDITNLLNGKVNIVLYPDLYRYRSIDEVMGPFQACILLFEAKPSYGHWCAIFKTDLNTVEFFNPYGGYPDDWVMCFFKIQVPDKNIPLGNKIPDGELIWMHKDTVLSSKYELVDDLHYCWKYIISNQSFFATTEIGEDEKVKKISLATL